MEIKSILSLAETHGDFYLYYRKQRAKGVTYLVGTTNFVNKYIIDKALTGKAGVPAGITAEQLCFEYPKELAKQGKVLVFSWTNDKFRILDAKDVSRVTPLSAELQNGRNNR